MIGAARKPRPLSQAWMITFVDLMALCVAFFVLLHAMGAPRSPGWSQAAGALGARLGTGAGQLPQVAPVDTLDRVHGLLRTRLGTAAPLARLADRVTLTLPAAALFDADGSALPEMLRLAASLAEVTRALPLRLDVTGHPAGSDGAYRPMQSWRLALAQAQALGAALRGAGFAGRIATLASGAGGERRFVLALFEDGGEVAPD